MSEQVLLILIPSVFSFLTAVLGVISLFISRRSVALSESNARGLVETKESIVEVVKNTNGMKTQLLDALAGKGQAEVSAAGAEGKLLGISEGLRQAKENISAAAFIPATAGIAAPTPSVAAAAASGETAIDTTGLKIVVEKQDLAGDISEKGPKA